MVDVVVIGGGLSGLSTGAALARKGLGVTVLEREEIGAGASGNVAGNVTPFISRSKDERSCFYDKAFAYSKSYLSSLEDIDLNECGAIQFPSTVKIERFIDENPNLKIDTKTASELSGIDVSSEGIFFKDAFSVSPIKVCQTLARKIQLKGSVRADFHAQGLEFDGKGWRIKSKDETIHCDALVIANAYECVSFKETSWIPTEKVRGELVYAESSDSSKKLRTILCYDGYLIPHSEGMHVLGATYDHSFLFPERSIEREERMRETLSRWAPKLKLGETVGGRVSFRATTHDRLPYVGVAPYVPAIVGDEWFLKNSDDREIVPGLFISMGHGSRGLLSCVYAGELLANLICGDSFDPESIDLLSPFRAFRWRARGGMLPGEKAISENAA